MAVVSGGVVERILEDAVSKGAFPGAVFALTDASGKVVEATAGSLKVGSDDPVTPSTMFRLMSMTKALASVGALQLIEEGKLALDQEVASILPAFASPMSRACRYLRVSGRMA